MQHPLGHPTYLDAKAEGESSMLGKVEPPKPSRSGDDRDPDVMVKPTLVEPQYPIRKVHGPDTTGDIRQLRRNSNVQAVRVQVVERCCDSTTSIPRSRVIVNDLKGMKRAPKTS
jgi:hypothetical protein